MDRECERREDGREGKGGVEELSRSSTPVDVCQGIQVRIRITSNHFQMSHLVSLMTAAERTPASCSSWVYSG